MLQYASVLVQMQGKSSEPQTHAYCAKNKSRTPTRSTMIMFEGRKIRKIFLLLVVLELISGAQSSVSKEKITSLVKRLEKLADKLEAGTSDSAKSGDEETEASKDEEMITTAPTKKGKTVKARDPSKSYCNAMECPVPKCTDRDIIYYGGLRKLTTAPVPPILSLCQTKICISAFMKTHSDVPNNCCVYNMTHMTINNDKMLGCAQEVHDFNKKSNPSTGVKYWTSGKWSPSCEKYVWCPDKEVIGSDAKWKKGFPKTGAGDCVGIHLGSSNPDNNGLYNGKCSEVIKNYCIDTDAE